MRRLMAALALALALPAPVARAQDFDYYLLALSWSPSWCATQGDATDEQCAPARDLGFVLHGLWPQFEDGWPADCATQARDPSRRETAAMADVMGSGGLAWYQWKKHGRCTGLDVADYFDLSRLAFALLSLPALVDGMTPDAVAAAFLEANPDLSRGALAVTCRDRVLREVRVCLTPDLKPRTCGADVARAACRDAAPLSLPAPP